MNFWENDPAFADFEALARKLEVAAAATNEALLKLANIEPQRLVEAFAQVQVRLLGFDLHAIKRFHQALEEKRVNTYARGNLFMTCVLTSAVALSEFKNQPQLAGGGGVLRKRLDKMRVYSTNSLSLAAFAWASFYAVMGQGAWQQLRIQRKKKPIQAWKR